MLCPCSGPGHVPSREAHGLRRHAGFTEHRCQLVFHYGERLTDNCGPWTIKTVSASGDVLSEQEVPAVPSGSLVCWSQPQSIDRANAQGFLEQNSPFVWERKDGSCALVEMWPVVFDEEFVRTFSPKSENPDPDRFSFSAVEEFRQSLVKIFGEEVVSRVGIRYCYRRIENPRPAFVGDSEALMQHLKAHPALAAGMHILALGRDAKGPEPLSFIAKMRVGHDQLRTQACTMSPGAKHVLYMQVGWETVARAKPLDEFLLFADFHLGDTMFDEDQPLLNSNNIFDATDAEMKVASVCRSGRATFQPSMDTVQEMQSAEKVAENSSSRLDADGSNPLAADGAEEAARQLSPVPSPAEEPRQEPGPEQEPAREPVQDPLSSMQVQTSGQPSPESAETSKKCCTIL